jgi:hypothetical protein
MMCLPFLSLPLMGQTVTRTEAQAVKSIEEMRSGRVEFREPGEWPEAGKQQLRAVARPWPDSTVTFTSAGERQSKSVYTYDASGNQTLYEYYKWEGGTWVNSSKGVSAYDAAGHEILFESYRWENNQWIRSYKTTNTYDNRGVNILFEEFNGRNNIWVKSSDEHYDRKIANSKVYVNFCVDYNEDGSRWRTALFTTGSGLSWATTALEESKMEYKATYDANDNLTLVETTILLDGKRVPFQRHILKYSNNNPVSVEVYYYIVNDIGPMVWKAANMYDAMGNRTLSEAYQWDWNSAGWIGLYRIVDTYEANGRELFHEFYSWDTSSGGWIMNSKNARTYDANGRELSYESYNWDTSSGGWLGSGKTTYEERNEYGDVLLYKSWSWKNSGWEWTSYTVSYPGGSAPNGTEYIGGAEPSVYIHGDVLYIQTVGAERIGVYTLNGAKVYESAVSPGTPVISGERLPKGVLIVRGSSGWAKKVLIR